VAAFASRFCCGDAPVDLRVVRGGAFNNEDRNVRCAYRNRNNPNNRNRNIGFRVVVVLVSRFSCLAKMSARPEQVEGFAVEAQLEKWRGAFLANLLMGLGKYRRAARPRPSGHAARQTNSDIESLGDFRSLS